jgi:hypothetical protein
MCQGYELVSYNKTRGFLNKNISGNVSKEAVKYCQYLLESQLKELCSKCVEEQKKRNQRRVECGLPQQRRFTVTLFKSVVVESYKTNSGLIIGESGQTNRDTLFSKE